MSSLPDEAADPMAPTAPPHVPTGTPLASHHESVPAQMVVPPHHVQRSHSMASVRDPASQSVTPVPPNPDSYSMPMVARYSPGQAGQPEFRPGMPHQPRLPLHQPPAQLPNQLPTQPHRLCHRSVVLTLAAIIPLPSHLYFSLHSGINGAGSLPATPFSPSTFSDAPSWPTTSESDDSEHMSLNQRNMLKVSVSHQLFLSSGYVMLIIHTRIYHCSLLLQWKDDEPLGLDATISPVLYANTEHPELKQQYPDWAERCKHVAKLWRKMSTELRAPYLVCFPPLSM